ncbi:MAG: auracyanin family protein, partial [Bacteroidetes bacterium]|nr:auracyanin family protein [Bacteroidota bacterium]
GSAPIKPENDTTLPTTPFFELQDKLPSIKPPAVWLPHTILGISTSQLLADNTNGEFGPFSGQVFIGDEGQSKIVRVSLEKVNGVYQGAAFAFREGFQSGVLRMTWGKDGSLFVGQTNRGWGSTGPKPFGLQRLVWTGKTPFEMKTVKAMPDGFEIEFTQPVDKATAANPDNYKITGFIYKYHPVYGSPVVNDEECFVKGVKVSRDGKSVRLVVDNLRKRYIHEINPVGVRSYYDQSRLLHSTAYYTLNEIPEGEKLNIPLRTEKKNMEHNHTTGNSAQKTEPVKTTSTSSSTALKLKKRQTTLPPDWKTGPDQTVILGTQPGLKYDKTDITVKAGSKIRWTFSNNDDMPHNCAVVKPGTADAVGDAALGLGLKGMEMNYIPNTSNILFHTKLLNPGVSESIYFVAPEQPGTYTYVCTFPGHAQIMRGALRVVK